MILQKGLMRLKAITLANSKNSKRVNQQVYTLLFQEDLYILAYENIKGNKGALTPAVGKERLQGFSLQRIHKIIDQMKTGTWKPKSSRRIYIPKPGKTVLRPLGIQGPDDKLVQEVVRLILNAIYNEGFSKNSYGFRPNLGCHNALKYVNENFDTISLVLEADISTFFDSIHHHKLLEILKLRISDQRFLNLIHQMLKVGYWEKTEGHQKSIVGTPQGSIISPILSNIYLNELDQWVENWIEIKITQKQTGQENLLRTPEQNSLRTQVLSNERALNKQLRMKSGIGQRNDISPKESCTWEKLNKKDPALKKFKKEYRKIKFKQLSLPLYLESSRHKRVRYVRYADDFIVGFVYCTKEMVEKFKADLSVFLLNHLKLILSQEKSKITNIYKEPAFFLGYNITISSSIKITTVRVKGKKPFQKKTTGHFIALTMPIDRVINKLNIKGYCTKLGFPIATKRLTPYSDLDIVNHYSAVHTGITNYYSGVKSNKSSNAFNRIYYILRFSCAKTLATKHKTSISKIFKKHGPTLKIQETKIYETIILNKVVTKESISTAELIDIKPDEQIFSTGKTFQDPFEKHLGKYTRSRLSDHKHQNKQKLQ